MVSTNRLWVRQIQMPPTKNHSTFMNVLRQLGCDGFRFTLEPNGQMASTPSFMLCKPNGMPMMVIIRTSPAMKYSMAVCSPPKISQMMFPNIFIVLQFKQTKLLLDRPSYTSDRGCTL